MANEATAGLKTTLRKDKEALACVRTELQQENVDFKASISMKLTKLSESLLAKNNLMDHLVAHTTIVKVHQAKLDQANKEIQDL